MFDVANINKQVRPEDIEVISNLKFQNLFILMRIYGVTPELQGKKSQVSIFNLRECKEHALVISTQIIPI